MNSGEFQIFHVVKRMSLKQYDVVSFHPRKNANIFCRFFSNLADSLLLKLPCPKNKFGIKTTEEYCKQIHSKCEDFALLNVNVASVEKILKNLDVAKASKIEQISARFFKGSAAVIAIHLANVINLSTKVDIFPSQGKIAEIKPLLKLKRLKLKKYRSNFLLPLITKVIEKFIYKQAKDYLQRNELL